MREQQLERCPCHVGTAAANRIAAAAGLALARCRRALRRLLRRRHVRSQPVHHHCQQRLDIGTRRQPRRVLQPRRQRGNVELGGEGLCDALHEVLLRDGVTAVDDLFEHLRQHRVTVHGQVDAVERCELREIGTDEHSQLEALLLARLALAHGALVLHPHPELVHLAKVGEDERDRIRNRAARALIL